LGFLARWARGKTILEIPEDENVFAQGDVADTVFYVQRGKVKLTVLSEQGKEAVVAILEPGQFFGEGCLNGHRLRIATTTAMEDCTIHCDLQGRDDRLLHEQPKFSELFMSYLLTATAGSRKI